MNESSKIDNKHEYAFVFSSYVGGNCLRNFTLQLLLFLLGRVVTLLFPLRRVLDKLPRVGDGNSLGSCAALAAKFLDGEQEFFTVFVLEIFICEFLSVNAFSPNPASVSEVAALEHEVRNDTMENAALVVQSLAFFANTLFACAKSSKVLRRSWDRLAVQAHCDARVLFRATDWSAIDLNIKEHFRSALRSSFFNFSPPFSLHSIDSNSGKSQKRKCGNKLHCDGQKSCVVK